MKRRNLLLGAATLPVLGALPRTARAASGEPIKIGLLEDVSGDLALFGLPKLHGSQLAVEEVNAAGGIMGRQIDLIHLDPQGDNARYQEFARRLLQRDKVDVLIGGITSASREAIRPIVDRTKTFYIYTNQYEGGVCDAHMLSNGAVPEQQLSTLLPWMVEKFGKKVYVIAADYNFGHLSAEWGHSIMKPLGVEFVGEEFIPLGVSQFAQTIQNIQRAKPDWLYMLDVGAAQSSFYEQKNAAGLHLPMGSPIKIMLGFEHKRFPPGVMKDMYATANWFEELDTPEAKAFVKTWRAKFPNEVYINDMGYNAWVAVHQYKMLVEKAKSTKLPDIRKAMADGKAAFAAPEGQIVIDPKSQHCSHHMRLISVDGENKVHVEKDFGEIKPYWLGQVGCNLLKSDPHEQYTPDNLPKT
ncbi:urea ABC transporter substrate-binding protein [Rhodopila sp.]|uniref:urea ABC transporter substrate-binding protein n=1 Tax=Rhodopila sp. TaxID=2480087 RepID=UPI003D09FAAD